jgi:alpha-beta hydrolase superfamily lysophospholipase
MWSAQLHQVNKQSCPNGKPIIIKNAKHELFLESDTFREPALQQALNWFNQHT